MGFRHGLGLTFSSVVLASSLQDIGTAVGQLHTNSSAAPTQQPVLCDYNGFQFDTLEFLTGRPGDEGSIYAVCDQGTLKCFEDDGVHDGLDGTKPLPSCPMTATTAHLHIRRLQSAEADETCTHKDVRIYGMMYLGDGAPGQKDSYYAICDEQGAKPTLKCYKDDGRVDSTQADKVTSCASLPAAQPSEIEETGSGEADPDDEGAERRSRSRRLDAYMVGEPLWPKGTVCYNYVLPASPSNVQQTLFNLRFPTMLQPRLDAAFADYESLTTLKFVSTADCLAKKMDVCNKCKHSINVKFELDSKKNEFGCWSYVGYHPEWPGGQDLNLSPGCWSHSTIVHEFGHAIGLHHDHQRPDRKVIIMRAGALASGVGLDQYATFKFKLGGKYDLNSVMHYDGSGIFLPLAKYKKKRFCDVFQGEWRHWCTIPQDKHCDKTQASLDSIGHAPTLSASDIASIKKLYAGNALKAKK